jgi:hypothetical protein
MALKAGLEKFLEKDVLAGMLQMTVNLKDPKLGS